MSHVEHSSAGRTMVSRWIWPFELLEKIGEGGMGVVYRARYVGNDRIVAVKLLPNDVADNPSLVARFDRELEILKQLRHPHIVYCFGGVCESKQRFYAMELVEGGTLAELLRDRGRFSWSHVVDYGLQMCAALQHAHERGVVHRDVKPGNFLIGKSGQLKLSDFGLATMASATRITRAGKTAGTFLYMAPEQIRGEPPVTAQTDLYALGCVLFELLTGHPPFDGDSPATILRKHLKEPPVRVATLVLDCPPALDQLVADLLEKNPAQRPESATLVESRLKSVVRPSITHIDPFARTPHAPIDVISAPSSADSETELVTPAKQRSLVPWILAICLLTLFGGMGWWRSMAAAGRIAALEASWVEMAGNSSDAGARWAALEQLRRAETLNTQTIAGVSALLEDRDPRIRIATLKVLESQPQAAGGRLAELSKIQQRDESADVRHQASLTTQAIRNAQPIVSMESWLGRILIVLITTAVLWWAWNHRVWDRWLHI
jgi:serine/threonine protein kinase